MSSIFEDQLKSATALTNDSERLVALRAVVFTESASDAESIKIKEQALTQLCDQLVKIQDAAGLASLLSQLHDFFRTIPKAKTAKLVRSLIDSIAKIPGSTALQVRYGLLSDDKRRCCTVPHFDLEQLPSCVHSSVTFTPDQVVCETAITLLLRH